MVCAVTIRTIREEIKMALAVALVFIWACGLSHPASAAGSSQPRLAGKSLTENFASLRFEEGYTSLFGGDNVKVAEDGKAVMLSLDKRTGSGLLSQDMYMYGFFSASIKLPDDYTAGIVAAFYTSNGDIFPGTHDELDFEFLGNIRGKEWRIQTNIYGNGSTAFGREERYTLWFDPTEDFHQYTILWTDKRIVFFVDDVPIREILKTEAIGAHYPAKPMSVYATVWDGSDWATLGGRYRVNYKYSPFVVTLSNLILEGCSVDPLEQFQFPTASCPTSASLSKFSELSQDQRASMDWFRGKYISYSYCDDTARYPTTPADCPPRDPRKKIATAHVKFGHHHQRHHKKNKKSHSSSSTSAASSL